MTVTFGRVGSDITLHSPTTYSYDGSKLSMAGTMRTSSAVDLQALYWQLRGLDENPDEDAVPITYTGDTQVNGLYRITSAKVEFAQGRLAARALNWSVEAMRTQHGPQAALESKVVGALRTNVSSITSASMIAVTALPPYALGRNARTYFNEQRLVGEQGVCVKLWKQNPTLPAALIATVPASSWYQGAVSLEANYGSATWRKVIGRQWPYPQNGLAAAWRMSNGLFRIGQDQEADPTQPGDLFLQSYRPGATLLASTGGLPGSSSADALWLPGYHGNDFASCGDKAGLRPSSAVAWEVVARVMADDWTDTNERAIYAKRASNSTDGPIAILVGNGSATSMRLYFGTSGGSWNYVTSSTTVALTQGKAYWFKWSVSAASPPVVTFQYAADDYGTNTAYYEPSVWTTLGTTVAMSGGGVYGGTDTGVPYVGRYASGGGFDGLIWRVIHRITGSVVLDFNARGAVSSGTWSDGYSNTWSITAAAGSWSAKRYAGLYTPAGYVTEFPASALLILRNGPDQGTVRLTYPNRADASLWADVTLRPAVRWADLGLVMEPLTGSNLGALYQNPGAAATSLTGGVRQTSDDAAGNRVVIAAADTFTPDTGGGGVLWSPTRPATIRAMVGLEERGSTGPPIDAAQQMIYQWLCAVAETRRVVQL